MSGFGGFNSLSGKAVRRDNKRVPKHLDPSQRVGGPIKPRQSNSSALNYLSKDDEPDDLILRATREALRRAGALP